MLVAEDRDEDVEILKLAFGKAQVTVPLHFVSNGEEAINYLNGDGRFANREEHPLPRVLLLDLSMPVKSGFEVLEWLQLQPGLRRLLVVVFTASELPEDVNRAFDLGANSYLVKPADFNKLKDIARYLDGYWLKLNRCPDCTRRNAPSSSTLSGPQRMTAKGPAVLLVDDDPTDIELTFTAFRRSGFENPIFVVRDKEDAIRYLGGEGEYVDRSRFPLPGLVLLDHSVSGEEWQVLKWVRNEPNLGNLPIVIFTGSENPADQKRAEEMGANAYHVKPQAFGDLVVLIQRIAEFWLLSGGVRDSEAS